MKQKELIKTIKELIKINKQQMGKACAIYAVNCPVCNGVILRAYLEDWIDNLEFLNEYKVIKP